MLCFTLEKQEKHLIIRVKFMSLFTEQNKIIENLFFGKVLLKLI